MRFGIDVSEHQDGLSLVRAAREGIEFAILRTTDGTYRDRCFSSHLADARAAGLDISVYHYLRNPSEGTSIAEQVEASLEVMGGAALPMWLDCETPAGLSRDHIAEAHALFTQRGVRVAGIYTYPHWWRWRMFGADTRPFGLLWLAAHGADPEGPPRDVFPGGWPRGVGKQKPAVWQFSSRGCVAGFSVDVNAWA
ncbi:glycoside hydrolase family 25 protein [Corynebacterium timonense]|uniref:Glycosyl hydrolases family 25 n=1 Tax=Corynebacterium timonense TaxID=441500 RepID=A0A1H1MD91_9CORY|nr:glycoside hydrolase family 25 protein [Corynebacterium timonense]SDR84801.1 Glycosyl hydrolases family 25 [Corynebacterium timonense]